VTVNNRNKQTHAYNRQRKRIAAGLTSMAQRNFCVGQASESLPGEVGEEEVGDQSAHEHGLARLVASRAA
jgi:hypothetical protein